VIGPVPLSSNMLPLGIAASDHFSFSTHQQNTIQLQQATILNNNNNDNHSHRSNYSNHSATNSLNTTAAINIPTVSLIPPIPLTTSVTAVQPLQNTLIAMASNTSLVTSIPPSAPTSISLDRRDTHSDHGRVASTNTPSLALIFGTAVDSTTANITPDNNDGDTKENLLKQGYVPIDELNKINNYNRDHHLQNEKNYSSNSLNHDNVLLSSSTSNKFNKNFTYSSNNLNRNNNNNNNNNHSRTSSNTNTKATIQSISVPNLYKKSSGSSIHISTGSMSTRLSAASRYKTATDNDDDDDDGGGGNDDAHVHPLSDQLKHSTVASMIESHFKPEPQKIFYEYPSTNQNPQNFTSSSQSKELNTSYIAVKYPTSNNQPWYPSSSASSLASSQQVQLHQPAHQNERTNQLKLAATTALRIKQHLSLSPEERKQMKKVRPRYGVSKSASATTISKSLKEYPFNNSHNHHHHSHEYSTHNRDDGNDIDDNNHDLTEIDKKSSEAVQRLTQENWRLFRKYERLERSIDELKGFKDHMYASSTDRRDTSPLSSSIKSTGRDRDRGRGREGDSERIGIVMDHNYNPHQMNGIDGNRQANLDTAGEILNIDRNDFTDADDVKVPWQLQIEKALLQIAIENKKLTERVSYRVTAHLCFIESSNFLFLYLSFYLSIFLSIYLSICLYLFFIINLCQYHSNNN
jgi:hypothetical protein